MKTIQCPRCGSLKVVTKNSGYRLGRGLAGSLLFGTMGWLTGFIGKNDEIAKCSNCGYTFKVR